MTPPITYLASPNHSSRMGTKIEIIVIHATAGSLESSLAWLRDPKTKVSSHYVIAKTGEIYQLVADDRCAWHAGRALWHGHIDINERSLGIELENWNTGHDDYPPAQLDACRLLCRRLIAAYAIARTNVVRHRDVATPNGRKSDPAGLPWPAFVDAVYALPDAPTLPAPSPMRYQVKPILISTKSTGGPPYAGALQPGQFVEIDATYPSGYAHLHNGVGFVLLSSLDPAGGTP